MPPPTHAVTRPPGRDDDADAARPAAFSGATPSFVPVLEPGEFEDLYPPSELAYGMAGLRGAVVELVSAVLAQDRAATDALLDRLAPHERDVEMAGQIALTASVPRIVVAADVQTEDGALAGEAAQQALAQGETLASRAESLRQATAPHCPPTLLGFASGTRCTPTAGSSRRTATTSTARTATCCSRRRCCWRRRVGTGRATPGTISAELELLLPDA
jgi:hypothetical protein